MSEDRERDYRFYLEPLDANATENIGLFLAAQGISKEESEHVSITVDGREVFGVYEMQYRHVSMVKRSQFAKRVRVYVQENQGKIRRYTRYDSKRTPRTKEGRKTVQGIKKAQARKAKPT